MHRYESAGTCVCEEGKDEEAGNREGGVNYRQCPAQQSTRQEHTGKEGGRRARMHA